MYSFRNKAWKSYIWYNQSKEIETLDYTNNNPINSILIVNMCNCF
jgi:hypothetical protein